jgi:hypothetical protein
MIVNSGKALRAFGRRCQMRREREKIDSVIRYYRSRTNPVRILDTTPLDGEIRDARDLVALCYSRNPCGLYGCPCCGRRFKATAKLDVLKRIAAKCGGLPDPSVNLIRHDQRSHWSPPRWNRRSVDPARRSPKCGTLTYPTRRESDSSTSR